MIIISGILKPGLTEYNSHHQMHFSLKIFISVTIYPALYAGMYLNLLETSAKHVSPSSSDSVKTTSLFARCCFPYLHYIKITPCQYERSPMGESPGN